MKVGIVVPFSWSFWGGVVDHSDQQAKALQGLGIETRTIIGHDPPGNFTRVLHPRVGRHDRPPPDVLPVGRSVIVPANGSLANIVLSPSAFLRLRRILAREHFDVVHLHEPMTPMICVATLALADVPAVATFHANGDLGWMHAAKPLWGFLADRIDHRIAVSEHAARSAARWLPGDFDIVPNGVLLPETADPADRKNHVVFIGRQEPRKGMPVMLRAWAEVHRRTGARLRLVGADPLAVRLLLARLRLSDEGIDLLGAIGNDELTAELLSAKALAAPSIGAESFGMVLTRALACATPVVASDITGYRDVMTSASGILVPPGDVDALVEALVGLLGDERRREAFGAAARQHAEENYAWDLVARRLTRIYELVAAGGRPPAAAVS
jgi:phosphatidylinositol alpha-mannosyltransferase